MNTADRLQAALDAACNALPPAADRYEARDILRAAFPADLTRTEARVLWWLRSVDLRIRQRYRDGSHVAVSVPAALPAAVTPSLFGEEAPHVPVR